MMLRALLFLSALCLLPSARAQWLAWAANEEPDLAAYRLTLTDDLGAERVQEVGTATRWALPGLPEGRIYTVTLIAIATSGLASAPSAPLIFRWPFTPLAAPVQPTLAAGEIALPVYFSSTITGAYTLLQNVIVNPPTTTGFFRLQP